MENIKKVNTQNQVKIKTKKKKMSKGGIVLLVGIIVILIPCLIFGGILLSAALETGKPVSGSRFNNDLNPSISNSNTKSLETTISAMSGVESCEIVLKSAQYRVNVNTTDSLSESQIKDLAVDVYNAVNTALPITTYFTSTDSEKMYDLSINVYNYISEDDDTMIYYILTKNSNMDTYSLQCVSSAVDEDLAAELRGETSNSSESTNEESGSEE